jgi:hypothetical protein
MEAQVKHFMLLKLPLLVLGIGAALLLTPACKAQSEVSPDHFDGTDSWAVAAQTVHAPVQKQAVTKTSLQAKSQKAAQASAFQLAAAREVTKPVSHDAVAIDRKRKPAARKPEKQ